MQLKNIGIFALLIGIVVIATWLNGSFVAPANLTTLVRDTSLYGLISIGVALVIMTGGIDLSIGSMIALCGVMFVQVIDVRFERTDFHSRIAEIERAPEGPLEHSALRLDVPPPQLREGDRLVYRGTTGEAFINVYRARTIGDRVWVESRDSLSLIGPQLEVGLQRIRYTPPLIAGATVLAFAAVIGLIHGLLITALRLQPFIVTLCGLMIYRGVARVWTGDSNVGLGSVLTDVKAIMTGPAFAIPLPLVGWISGEVDRASQVVWIDFPVTGLALAIVAIAAWLFLKRTIWGRHLLAAGENEQAARYSGVSTDRLITAAYVACSLLAGLTGILVTFEWNSVQPNTTGQYYELYAIAAAVLGGCSLRGGRGAVLGVIAGAAVMRCLYKAIVILGIPAEWEFVIIGAALLLSVLTDEVIRRAREHRRIARAAL